jgi:uncharacterized protein (TIGR00297 family)
VESLPAVIDDNLAITWVGACSFALLFSIGSSHPETAIDWKLAVGVNVVPALAALWLRWISPRGVLLACLFGTVIALGLGLAAYLTICLFLLLGSLATRIGLENKLRQGIAEPNRGRRGLANVLANGAVPFVLAGLGLWIKDPVISLAFVAAAATAAFDTVATEIGQLLGKTTFDPVSFRKVPVGTPGAVSLEGTIAGLGAAAVLALVPAFAGWLPPGGELVVLVAAAVGGLSESIVVALLKPEEAHAGEVFNFYNTLLGATVGAVLWGTGFSTGPLIS